MKKPLHGYPFIFALYPLLTLLTHSTSPHLIQSELKTAALLALGGIVLYLALWFFIKQPGRAALLAGLWILLYNAYTPVYELIEDRALGGFIYGRHRYLLPVWVGLALVASFLMIRGLKRDRALTAVFNVSAAGMLVVGLVYSAISGSYLAPLRAVGLLPPPKLEVTYIDVGNIGDDREGMVGDSILLHTSDGHVALIDGGYNNGMALEYLQEHGVTHIDLVVLTHPHDDHAGGLIEVLRAIPADLLVSNGQPLENAPVYDEYRRAVEESGIKEQIVMEGDVLPFGTLYFEVLNPRALIPDNHNHGSVVLRLVNGEVSFLFTGDMDWLAESILLQGGTHVQSTILKVAHHGYNNQSKPPFIAKVAPEVAIYSAGPNIPDFPHAETLSTLFEVGAVIYGTDVNGDITVKTDGKTYEVLTERGGPLD